MATTISIALQKGGTGKSTTAQALASSLGNKKKRVLLVDMDSQANVTSASGIEPTKTITDVLADECTLKDSIIQCSLYDLIASDSYLANLEQIENLENTLLKNELDKIKKEYDYIIIDTPPLLGNILKNCLMASDYIIIPVEPRPFALNGLNAFYNTFKSVQEVNRKLKILGILLIKYSNRTVLNRQIAEELNDKAKMFNTTVFTNSIREGIAVPEAQTVGESLIEYAPHSKPCIDYKGLTTEIIKKLEG